MGFLTWDSEGIHRQNKQQGRAFKDFSMACYGAGHQMYYFDLQLAHLSIPQYRERLWCVPIRGDVCEEIGDFPTPQLPTSVSPQIGPFLLQDQSYYKVVAQMSALRREEGQIHHDYKPHLIGTVRLAEEGWFQVWGATGVSPCISHHPKAVSNGTQLPHIIAINVLELFLPRSPHQDGIEVLASEVVLEDLFVLNLHLEKR